VMSMNHASAQAVPAGASLGSRRDGAPNGRARLRKHSRGQRHAA
jgi:hypothetical protein